MYPNPRAELRDAWLRGEAPDSGLLGQNHMAEFGIDAVVHDPLLGRPANSRLRWHLREVTLPWEIRDADVAVTPLYRFFPAIARTVRRPRTVVFNFGFNVILARSRGLRRRLDRTLLRTPTLVACLADVQREGFVELSRIDPERVRTVRVGVDARFFAPSAGAVADESLVFSVGKDLARDYGTLAEAMRGLDARAVFTCHERNLREVEVPANVSLENYSYPGLRSAYAQAGCVVLSQFPDGHPEGTEAGGLTALLEAMAMARPIVATDRAVVREYVTDGESALLVPAGEPEALRTAMQRLLGDRALARRLGAAARARVEASLTSAHLAGSLAPLVRAAAS